ncbi:substrate-binding domain-containing protein [Fodinisporobacter ferrooxydans]|uniref:Substrate-binding domain-containing protein n=1 Tax=Fodinisporobacter ferrooxydans TaxID=2901836 RepID=A0ABY4CIS8_9BACL|nr:substrate-binding domain-containing protein [Alicyclobacillaceae bacterium MYW30-H2]
MKKHLVKNIGVTIAVTSMMATLLVGCGSSATTTQNSSNKNSNQQSGTSSKKLKIGFSVYGLKAEFANLLKNSMEKEAKAKGVDLLVMDGNYSANTAISQLQNLATEKVNAIIVDPIDANALNNTVNQIVDQGIPVIGVNAKMTAQKLTSYVGSPDVKAGEMEAEQMAKALNGKGNIVILDGPIGQSAQIERKQGIFNVLKKYPEIHVLAEKTANWSRAEGLTLMENWLQAFSGKINGVIGENDEMALGAEKALQEKNLKLPVVGVDGVKDALTAVKDGKQIASIYQNAIAQGKKSLDVAVEAAQGKKIDKNYDIPFELVTKDNVDKYLNGTN